MVFEESHELIFDYFVRNSKVDLSWVKSQVYGPDPEIFPEKVIGLNDIFKRLLVKKLVQKEHSNMNSRYISKR